MAILSKEEAILRIKKPKNAINIELSRKRYEVLNMHVNGVDVVITKIDGYENDTQKKLKDKLSKSNIALFQRVLQPRNKAISAKGGSKYYNIESEKLRDQFSKAKYKGLTVEKWIEQHINKWDVDPDGLFFIEIDKNGEPYPTYKSITDIYDYDFDGLAVEYVIFEPKKLKDGTKLYRVFDDKEDRIFSTKNDEDFVLLRNEIFSKDKVLFKNQASKVPCIRISDIPDNVHNIFKSPIWDAVESAQEYMDNSSAFSVNKYSHLFSIFWRITQDCVFCDGEKQIDGKPCKYCDGTGLRLHKDVSDIINIPMPQEGESMVTPAGYIPTDVDTIAAIRTEIEAQYKEIEFLIWGSNTREEATDETATAIFLNNQAAEDTLNKTSVWLESSEKSLTDFIGEITIKNAYKGSTIRRGRMYTLESPDIIMAKYIKERAGGVPVVILNLRISQYFQAEFESDSIMALTKSIMLKLTPYYHNSISEVKSFATNEIDYYKKLYVEEWQKTLTEKDLLTKDYKTLNEELTKFAQTKIKTKPVEVDPRV